MISLSEIPNGFSPVKILMPFTRSSGGGGFFSAALLAKGLKNSGSRVCALFPEEGRAADIFREFGVEVKISGIPVINSIKKKPNAIFMFVVRGIATYWGARKILSEENYDVVYCNDDTSMLPWGKAAKTKNVPCVWHVRTSRKGLTDYFRLRTADAIVCISQYVSRRIPDQYTISVIPNPVDTDRFKPVSRKMQSRRMLKIKPDGVLFIQIGRDVNYKRPEWSIAALSESLKAGGDASLVFLGDFTGQRQRELLDPYPEFVRDRIFFKGWVREPERYLAAADALLHPADGEHFGRVFIEAEACKVPVIATNTGAAPEIIEQNQTGYLADGYEDFLKAVSWFGSSKLYSEDSECFGVKFTSKYRIDAHAEAVLNVLRVTVK